MKLTTFLTPVAIALIAAGCASTGGLVPQAQQAQPEQLAAQQSLADARVSQRLSAIGIVQASESVEDWGGTVLTRRYEGRCETSEQAAAAIRFFCEESEQQVNLAAE